MRRHSCDCHHATNKPHLLAAAVQWLISISSANQSNMHSVTCSPIHSATFAIGKHFIARLLLQTAGSHAHPDTDENQHMHSAACTHGRCLLLPTWLLSPKLEASPAPKHHNIPPRPTPCSCAQTCAASGYMYNSCSVLQQQWRLPLPCAITRLRCDSTCGAAVALQEARVLLPPLLHGAAQRHCCFGWPLLSSALLLRLPPSRCCICCCRVNR